jgi:hypothetical protein
MAPVSQSGSYVSAIKRQEEEEEEEEKEFFPNQKNYLNSAAACDEGEREGRAIFSRGPHLERMRTDGSNLISGVPPSHWGIADGGGILTIL